VYYDLTKEREKLGLDSSIAITRLEQISPFPYDIIIEEMNKYANAKIQWVQEEHKNMGAWNYVQARIHTAGNWQRRCTYAGRPACAATATGNKFTHLSELANFLSDAMKLD